MWWVAGGILCPCASTHGNDAGEYSCGYVEVAVVEGGCEVDPRR